MKLSTRKLTKMTKSKGTIPFRELTPEQQLMVANHDLTPDIVKKLENLMDFWSSRGIDYDRFEFDKKKAYPNYDQYMNIPSQHNMQKWMDTVQNIYKMEHSGHSRVASIRQVTSGWKVTETFDFLNWLRFYEQGAHLKYKMAQLWYENGAPGYFLHVKPDSIKEPEQQVTGKDIDFAREESSINAEKRQVIEKQRNKIIGRLDSAEKLLRSPDGQTFAGPELDALMEAIYQLKRKIQMVNKLSTSTRLYEDMIVREANVLQRQGFTKAAELLYTTAQANNPPPAGIGAPGGINVIPSPDPPESPSAPLHPGAPGGLPSVGPGMSQNAPAGTGTPEAGPNENSPTKMKDDPGPQPTAGTSPVSVSPDQVAPTGIQDFLANMDTSKMTTQEDKSVADDDELEVRDAEPLEVQDDDHLMITEAQFATPGPIDEPITTTPPPAKSPPVVDEPATETPLEVTEDDVAQPPKSEQGEAPNAADFDAKVDAVFSNITVADVVAKLEDISKIYKTREVPRQLGIVDMMLDSLGLASYFPALSEAINKALESNNYISTRLDEILSRLRGAVPSNTAIDLKGGDAEKPEVAGIKKNLTDTDEKEKRRKQQRKEQAAVELEGGIKETPEVEIEEDLGPKPLVPSVRQPAAGPAPVARPLG
jgi:hypothetical protein